MLNLIQSWDSNIYLQLAQNGYTNLGDPSNWIVFLPLFPKVLSFTTKIFGFKFFAIQATVLTISSLAMFSFYSMTKLVFNKNIAKKALLFLLICPTFYFLLIPYAEGLFILLFSLAYLADYKKKYLLAGIFSGLASITRPFGLLIAPSLVLGSKKKTFRKVVSLLFPTAIFYSLYLLLNYKLFGDPFVFRKILSEHWHKEFSLPFIGIYGSWRTLFGVGTPERKLMIGGSEAVVSTLLWVLIPIAFSKLNRKMFFYYLLSTVLATSTSFLLSIPRYLLSIPPFFVMLAKAINNKYVILIFILLGAIANVFLLNRFLLGMWAY